MIRATAGNSFFQWPIPDSKGSQNDNDQPGFNACRGDHCERRHRGVDVYANFGAPVVAPEDGTINTVGGSAISDATEAAGGGKGRYIIMKGSSGETYTFMHLEGFSDAVLKGAGLSDQIGNTQKSVTVAVKGGDTVAYVGNTGGIQNPHLHFEMGPSGSQKDPAPSMTAWLSGTATVPSAQRSVEACSTVSPTTTNGTLGEKVVELGRTQLNKTYDWGGCHANYASSPPPGGCSHYDCSGFVNWAWYWGSDKKFKVGDSSADIWAQRNDTSKFQQITDLKSLQAGDVLVYNNGSKGHVMLATGKGTALEFYTQDKPGREWTISESRLKTKGYVYLRPIIK